MTTTAPAAPARPVPKPVGARILDLALALLAHAAVGASWVLVAASVMGSLDVLSRMVMNSEFAWDTGRLPQPWVIGLGIVGIVMAHLLFGWVMRSLGRGRAAWGPSVIAWSGALLGVALGAYLWVPPLQVGEQVGPASGQSTPWGVLGWIAHYARLALPALVGVITAALLLFSRNSPLVVLYRWWRDRRRRPGRSRRPRRTRTSEPAPV